MNRSLQLTMVLSAVLAIGSERARPLAAQTTFTDFQQTTVPYREVGGHEILADVYRPDDAQVRPVVVWIHGGALINGSRERVHPQVAALAAERGYAVVSIDYRLAPEAKLPEIISDIEAAFRWLGGEAADRYDLDPQRIVVTGGSAGGYLTLVTGYRASPKPKALVSLYGYGELTGDWYSQPSPHPRHNPRPITREEALAQTDGTVISNAGQRQGDGRLIYLYYRQHGLWPQEVSGFAPSDIAEKIAPYEPVRNVTSAYPPTLLIHGTSDTDVPFEQSHMMAAQSAEHGVPHRLIPIQGAEHGFGGGDPDEIERAYLTMGEFIVQHLEAD